MIGFFIRLIVSVLALLAIAGVSGGQIVTTNLMATIVAALLLGVANAVVRPILLAVAKSATCVLSCLTLGLWSLLLSWLINGLLFYIVGQLKFGFEVQSFWAALWGALALSIVNALATALTKGHDEDER